MRTLKGPFFSLLVLCISVALSAQVDTRTEIFFESNSSVIDKNSKTELEVWLKTNVTESIDRIEVVGFTDASGSAEQNLLLSEQRAEAVVLHLKSLGVKGSLVKKDFMGERNPVASNTTTQGKEMNRRVELKCVYKVQRPEKLLPKVMRFKVDAKKGGDVSIGSKGTVVHVPANAFVDSKGNVVKGEVNLHFQEYTNASEMAFSGIPMTYKDGLFNSAGMFDFRGTSNGESVEIASDKSLTIDYALAQNHKDLGFYQLDKEAGTWEKIQDLEMLESTSLMEEEKAEVVFDTNEVEVAKPVIVQTLPVLTKKEIRAQNKEVWVARARAMKAGENTGTSSQPVFMQNGYVTDAGHYYPAIISGLRIKSFGVYNCDQVYRLKNRLSITASYVDEMGREIENTSVLSMMDLRYNSAFSFNPSNFVCSANGRNVLVLFTFDKKL